MFSFVGEQLFSKCCAFQKPWQNKMLEELYTYQKTTTILLLVTGDNNLSALYIAMFHTLVIPKDSFRCSQIYDKKKQVCVLEVLSIAF